MQNGLDPGHPILGGIVTGIIVGALGLFGGCAVDLSNRGDVGTYMVVGGVAGFLVGFLLGWLGHRS
jgi:hypothetical protein